MRWKSYKKTFGALVALALGIAGNNGTAADFNYNADAFHSAKPWTSEDFNNNPDNFQFIVVGDRTGGANVEGTFDLAAEQGQGPHTDRVRSILHAARHAVQGRQRPGLRRTGGPTPGAFFGGGDT